MPLAKLKRLDVEENVVRGKTSPAASLCLEKGPPFSYEGGEPQTPAAEEMGLNKRKLLSSMTSIEINGSRLGLAVKAARKNGLREPEGKEWKKREGNSTEKEA